MTHHIPDETDAAPPSPMAGLKILVVEDDFVGRKLLTKHLSAFGEVDVAVDGSEALKAFYLESSKKEPYDLICLDIMMPEMDGQQVLASIRETETKMGVPPGRGVKIIMTTALDDSQNIMLAFKEQCDGYLVKPIRKDMLFQKLAEMQLIEKPAGQG